MFCLLFSCCCCFSVLTGCERNNKYKICNTMNQQVYFAQEGKLYACYFIKNLLVKVYTCDEPLTANSVNCKLTNQNVEYSANVGQDTLTVIILKTSVHKSQRFFHCFLFND